MGAPGDIEAFLEQAPVDVGELGQLVGQVLGPPVRRGVQHTEQGVELSAEVSAVLTGPQQQVVLE